MYKSIKNSKNPKSLIDYYAAANPEFKEAMNFMGQNGGSLKDVFYAMAKRKGTNPDEIISPLKNLRLIESKAAEINANTTAQTQKILDAIAGNRMADMQNQINQLQLQQAMSGVVRYPDSFAYNAGSNPFCNCNGCCGR